MLTKGSVLREVGRASGSEVVKSWSYREGVEWER